MLLLNTRIFGQFYSFLLTWVGFPYYYVSLPRKCLTNLFLLPIHYVVTSCIYSLYFFIDQSLHESSLPTFSVQHFQYIIKNLIYYLYLNNSFPIIWRVKSVQLYTTDIHGENPTRGQVRDKSFYSSTKWRSRTGITALASKYQRQRQRQQIMSGWANSISAALVVRLKAKKAASSSTNSWRKKILEGIYASGHLLKGIVILDF